MEDTLEEIKQNAEGKDNGDNPLCFMISTLYEWGPSDQWSDPVCMYRCGWDEDCNFFLQMENNNDEDAWADVELDSCAGQSGLSLELNCYDWGFCNDKEEGRDQVMRIEAGWEFYYWIPTVYTSNSDGPVLCQNKYKVMGLKNIEWWYDEWMCDGDQIESDLCQWLVIMPNEDMSIESTEEMWIWIEVSIAGTNKAANFFQFWEIDDGLWDCYGEEGCEMPSDWEPEDDWLPPDDFDAGDDWVPPSDWDPCAEFPEDCDFMDYDWYECPEDDPDCDAFECPMDDPYCDPMEFMNEWMDCPADDPDCTGMMNDMMGDW